MRRLEANWPSDTLICRPETAREPPAADVSRLRPSSRLACSEKHHRTAQIVRHGREPDLQARLGQPQPAHPPQSVTALPGPKHARHRRRWRVWQRYMDAERLVFLDETAATTAMTRLYGCGPRGERLVDAVPAGHVWTPPPVQEESLDRLRRVIGCCHVSGLCCGVITGRGPVWEFGDQVHITGTRSKRYPCAWFS